MCGIGGVISKDEVLRNDYIDWINSKQKYRGPDNTDVFFDGNIGLCHQRLSIIDLSARSNQPYNFSNIVLSFNGEVYNYNDLLSKKKYSHLSSIYSDTSFFAKSWNDLGESILQDLEGMYAASIYTKNSNTITLVADQFGIKSLYYYRNEDLLLWASEFEALFSFIKNRGLNYDISHKSLESIYSFLAPLCGETLVKQINRVLPGEILTFNKNAHLIKKKYDIFFNKINKNSHKINSKYISKQISKTFISDASLSTMISGGIDSSYICCQGVKKKINQHLYHYKHPSSSEGFISDTKYADQLSKKLDLRLNYVEGSNLNKDVIKKVFKCITVSGDITAAIPLFFICKKISSTSNCKVLLSGLGADEIFHGYRLHRVIAIKEIFLSNFSQLFKLLNYISIPIIRYFSKPTARRIKISLDILSRSSSFVPINAFTWGSSNEELNNEFIKHYRNLGIVSSSSFSQTVSLFFLHFLAAVHLPVSDSVSMSHSIELRPVFLIKNLINSSTMQPNILNILKPKIHLKKFIEVLMGKEYVNRPKVGFGVEPSLFSKEIIDSLFMIIDKSKLCSSSLIERIEKDLDDEESPIYSRKLYGLISLAHSICILDPNLLKFL